MFESVTHRFDLIEKQLHLKLDFLHMFFKSILILFLTFINLLLGVYLFLYIWCSCLRLLNQLIILKILCFLDWYLRFQAIMQWIHQGRVQLLLEMLLITCLLVDEISEHLFVLLQIDSHIIQSTLQYLILFHQFKDIVIQMCILLTELSHSLLHLYYHGRLQS